MAKRVLEVQIVGDANSLSRALGKAGKSTDKFGKQMGMVGRISSKTGASFGVLARGGAAAGIGLIAAGAGAKKLIDAFGESERVAKQTETVIRSTGKSANVTAKHVGDLATAISQKSGMDDEAVQSGANLALTFTNIENAAGAGNKIFDRTVRAAGNMSAAFEAAGKKMSISDAALQLGKALNDPEKGMTRLTRVGVTFSDAQKKVVAAAVNVGDKFKAQRVILRELNKEFGGSLKAAGAGAQGAFRKLGVAAGNLQEKIGGLLAPALTAGAKKLTTFFRQMEKGTGAGGRFVDAIKGISGAVTGTFGAAVDKVRSLVHLFDSLRTGGASVGEALSKVLSAAFQSVDWQGIGEKMSAGLSGAMNFTDKMPAAITQGISAAMAQVDGRQVLGKLLDVVGEALDALFSPSFWIDHFKAIFSIVTIFIPVGKILKIPGAAFLFKWISAPFFKAVGFLGKGLLSLLGKAGSAAFTGFLAGIEKFSPKVAHFFLNLATLSGKSLKGLGSKIAAPFKSAINRVGSAISGGIGRVGEAFGSLVGRGIAILRDGAGAYFSAAKFVVTRYVKGLLSILKAVAGAAGKIGQKAVEPLHNFGKRFFELGKNLILGLIGGIKSVAQDVANAAKDVAKGAVDGVKGFLGIKSPSRVFMEIGRNIGKGLATGISGSAADVAAGARKGLLFPLEAEIAKLERLQARLERSLSKAQGKRDKLRGRLNDLRSNRSSSGGSSGGGGVSIGGGDIVALGKQLQAQGYQVGEHPAFGGVHPVHTSGSYHYSGNALDVNADGRGQAYENQRLDALAAKLKGMPGVVELLWRTAGHFDHLHVALKGTAVKARAAIAAATGGGGSGGSDKGGSIGKVGKDLKAANEQVKKIKDRLKTVTFNQRALTQLQTWRDTLAGIATDLQGKVSTAADAFAEKWENSVGKTIDKTNAKILQGLDDVNAKALDAFDAETARLVANSPAAAALAGLEAESERIRAQAEDASNQQALDDARRSGDPRAIQAAKDAIAETARQRQLTALQAQAESERAAIEQQRAVERTEMERTQAEERTRIEEEQATARETQRQTDTTAFSAKLKTDLDNEYKSLTARGQNYASFVRKVNAILNRVGDGSTDALYVPDASAEAAITAGPGAFGGVSMTKVYKPGSAQAQAQWMQAAANANRGKRAVGGPLDYGVIYQVNELGREGIVRMPSGEPRVVQASESRGGGGRGGNVIITGPVSIGSRKQAEVLANRYAYRMRFG